MADGCEPEALVPPQPPARTELAQLCCSAGRCGAELGAQCWRQAAGQDGRDAAHWAQAGGELVPLDEAPAEPTHRKHTAGAGHSSHGGKWGQGTVAAATGSGCTMGSGGLLARMGVPPLWQTGARPCLQLRGLQIPPCPLGWCRQGSGHVPLPLQRSPARAHPSAPGSPCWVSAQTSASRTPTAPGTRSAAGMAAAKCPA